MQLWRQGKGRGGEEVKRKGGGKQGECQVQSLWLLPVTGPGVCEDSYAGRHLWSSDLSMGSPREEVGARPGFFFFKPMLTIPGRSFPQCSQRHCTFSASCLHGMYLSFCQLNPFSEDEKWSLQLILPCMSSVLRMENIGSYLSFKDRIRIFIDSKK